MFPDEVKEMQTRTKDFRLLMEELPNIGAKFWETMEDKIYIFSF